MDFERHYERPQCQAVTLKHVDPDSFQIMTDDRTIITKKESIVTNAGKPYTMSCMPTHFFCRLQNGTGTACKPGYNRINN